MAVAAGSYVFIYRQLRPYRKWTCPSVEIVPEETEVWSDLKIDMIDVPTAIQRLLRIREEGLVLSARSMDLILMDEDDHEARLDYVNDMKTIQNYTQQTLLTCMTSIKKDSEDPDAITYLVVGTESGRVYVLPQDASGSSFLCKVSLPPGAIPTLLLVSGLFDVEWRILAACRDGRIYTIKSGSVRGTAVVTGNSIDCGCQIVSMAKQDKFIWVATMDKQLVCYSVKGKRTSTIVMNDDIVDVTCINIRKARTVSVLLVALASGEVRIYKDNKVFHSFCVEKPITALCFGPYGREENSLVIAHGQGSLTFKILKRKIDFDSNSASASGFGAPAEQDTPLAIPKKTKLYVEQTQRERELASDIHRIFQKDLCRLRLETARAYVKTLTDGNLMVSTIPVSRVLEMCVL